MEGMVMEIKTRNESKFFFVNTFITGITFIVYAFKGFGYKLRKVLRHDKII